MQSVSTTLTIANSQNGVPFYAVPWTPSSQKIALTQDTSTALAIPQGMNAAILYYSAGSTVMVKQDVIGVPLTAPTGSFTATTAKINPPSLILDATNSNGDKLYLYFLSPNPNDWLIVGFYDYLGYYNTGIA
jgi:hypothetical protein